MPKLKQIRKFLRKNGWVLVKNSDHEYYEKSLPDGSTLYTRLSHGDGEIPAPVWHKIRKQIQYD